MMSSDNRLVGAPRRTVEEEEGGAHLGPFHSPNSPGHFGGPTYLQPTLQAGSPQGITPLGDCGRDPLLSEASLTPDDHHFLTRNNCTDSNVLDISGEHFDMSDGELEDRAHRAAQVLEMSTDDEDDEANAAIWNAMATLEASQNEAVDVLGKSGELWPQGGVDRMVSDTNSPPLLADGILTQQQQWLYRPIQPKGGIATTTNSCTAELSKDVGETPSSPKKSPKRKRNGVTTGPFRKVKRLQKYPPGHVAQRKNKAGSQYQIDYRGLTRQQIKTLVGNAVRNFQAGIAVDVVDQVLRTMVNENHIPLEIRQEIVSYLKGNFGVVLSTFRLYQAVNLQQCYSLRKLVLNALSAIRGSVDASDIPLELRDLLKTRKNAPGHAYPRIKDLTEERMKNVLGWSEHRRRHCEIWACERSLLMALITRSYLSTKAVDFVDRVLGLKDYWLAFLVDKLPQKEGTVGCQVPSPGL